jgi:hypothetical protein
MGIGRLPPKHYKTGRFSRRVEKENTVIKFFLKDIINE